MNAGMMQQSRAAVAEKETELSEAIQDALDIPTLKNGISVLIALDNVWEAQEMLRMAELEAMASVRGRTL